MSIQKDVESLNVSQILQDSSIVLSVRRAMEQVRAVVKAGGVDAGADCAPNSDMGRCNFGMTQQEDDCFISIVQRSGSVFREEKEPQEEEPQEAINIS